VQPSTADVPNLLGDDILWSQRGNLRKHECYRCRRKYPCPYFWSILWSWSILFLPAIKSIFKQKLSFELPKWDDCCHWIYFPLDVLAIIQWSSCIRSCSVTNHCQYSFSHQFKLHGWSYYRQDLIWKTWNGNHAQCNSCWRCSYWIIMRSYHRTLGCYVHWSSWRYLVFCWLLKNRSMVVRKNWSIRYLWSEQSSLYAWYLCCNSQCYSNFNFRKQRIPLRLLHNYRWRRFIFQVSLSPNPCIDYYSSHFYPEWSFRWLHLQSWNFQPSSRLVQRWRPLPRCDPQVP